MAHIVHLALQVLLPDCSLPPSVSLFGPGPSGALSVFCRTLLEHLDRLPGDARTLVGLLTFDSALHFYAFTVSLALPRVAIVVGSQLPL